MNGECRPNRYPRQVILRVYVASEVYLASEVYVASAHGDNRRAGSIGDIELGKYALDVVLDRVLDDIEIERDSLVGMSLSDPSQHVEFPGGECIIGRVLRELQGDFRRNTALACMDHSDRVDQLGAQKVLQKIADGSSFERA